jgi:tryptophanyl-tRNA synthetase
MPDSIANLFTLMQLVTAPEVVKSFENAYQDQSIRYGDMKKQLAEDMVNFMAPIREKAQALQQDPAYLQKILRTGAEKARASAAQTLQAARKLIGINYY